MASARRLRTPREPLQVCSTGETQSGDSSSVTHHEGACFQKPKYSLSVFSFSLPLFLPFLSFFPVAYSALIHCCIQFGEKK